MKRRLMLMCLVGLLVTAVISVASEKTYTQARVYIDSIEQRQQLLKLPLDIIWYGKDDIEIVTDAEQLQKLQQLGLRTEIIHEDMTAFYQSRLPDKDMGGYKTLSEIEVELWFINYLHPAIASTTMVIGQTIEGRDIWAVKISDNWEDDEDEPEILFTSAIHAREVITPDVLLHYMNHLVNNYGTDPEVTDLVDNREIWFVPVVNPDGYYHNEFTNPGGGGMWRKNRRDNGNGTFGVDLNRNFGYMWGYDDIGSSSNPADETYRGTGPFSEPESQVMRDFTLAHDFQIVIYYHSYSNLILWAWGYETGLYTPDQPIFQAAGDSMSHFNNYNPQVGWLLYPTNGDTDDWYYGEQTAKDKIFSFTFEVGGYEDGFWPPTTRIPQLIEENIQPNLLLTKLADNIHDILMPNKPSISTPDTIIGDQPYNIEWTLEDTLNPAINYELLEMTGKAVITEPANTFDRWDNNGFVIHSYGSPNRNCFYSGNPETRERYVQSIIPYTVQVGDTLRFKTYYEIQPQWDYAYVEISTDGEYYTPIEGNITTNDNNYGHNRGNGITGDSEGWVDALFDLSDFVAEDIYIRFSYRDYNTLYSWWGFQVDDIYPSPGFDTITVLSSSIVDTFYTVSHADPNLYYYRVRGQDDDSQWGEYSETDSAFVLSANCCLAHGTPGDATGDGSVNLSDILDAISYVYVDPLGEPAAYQNCNALYDVDGSGATHELPEVNLTDILAMISHVYVAPIGQPVLCCPPQCQIP